LRIPWVQILVSLVLTILFGIAASFIKNFNGAGRFILLAYHLPIGFAFSMFVLTEIANLRKERVARHFTSILVTGLSLLRVLMEVPFYSGHAFFITYMVLVTESLAARIVAVLVLLDVIYVKEWLLHDPTVWGGMLLGLVAFVFVGWVDCNIKVLDR
jgi:dolichyl-phosphate-mannose--protein O-mannosyl transferase